MIEFLFLKVYLFPLIILGIFVTGGGLAVFLGTVRAGHVLHLGLLRNIIASPMNFFDTTPIGRILNRFGKDIDVVDSIIAHNFAMWILLILRVLSIPVVIGYSTPLFLTTAVPLAIVYYVIQVGKFGVTIIALDIWMLFW